MKKILSLLLLSVLLVSLFSCGGGEKKSEAYLGLGHVIDHEEYPGNPVHFVYVAAAVIDGKEETVISIALDAYMATATVGEGGICEEGSAESATASAIGADSFKAMIADITEKVVGKTADEIEALGEAETEDEVAHMYTALAYAVRTAKSPCAKTDKPGVAIAGKMSVKNADPLSETNGNVTSEIDVAAVALNADGKVSGAAIDAMTVKREFDASGTLIAPAAVKTKRELGYDYGMKEISGIKREWFEQAEGFCAYLSGKTAEEIGAIGVANGYPTEDALLSSCTIAISGMIAVSVAAATAAAAE